MTLVQDAFISYGRADSKEFAQRLNRRLLDRGYTVWFDFEDIPLGVDYQKQIDEGIDSSHNFLFIISPHSINSPYCRLEIDLALKRNKRMIPLLHVESISYETWQHRHPQGTLAQWEAYQAEGKHSSYPNMHPEIGKINWIYMREELDDFDSSFEDLMTVIERQKNYVYQHTALLKQALQWERNQKQSVYLLLGEDLLQAKDWLLTRFTTEQPPCLPTELHCEFITESIKFSKNQMTQVFLAYATEDREVMHKIRRSLLLQSFTVWTSQTDIQTGKDFQKSIEQGIEETDNLVYLLSPQALVSHYCTYELDYARSLHKRIIPILVEAIGPSTLAPDLQLLQYIDLTDNINEDDYQLDENQLLKVLKTNADYHERHKILLNQALKWQRHDCLPSLLLRGHTLPQAQAWLKIAQKQPTYPPTALQIEYIETSLAQPPQLNFDVFISYCEIDGDFAYKLNEALQIQGKYTWFEQESLTDEMDHLAELEQGITQSDQCVFILSPSFLKSQEKKQLLTIANRLNKSMIFVICRSVDTTALAAEFKAGLWVDFSRGAEGYFEGFKELLRILDTDRDHLQIHTRLLMRAMEWEGSCRNDSLLLRGDDLRAAEQWLKACAELKKQPEPSLLHHRFVEKSREVEAAEQRLLEAGRRSQQIVQVGWIFLCTILTAGVVTWFGAQAIRQKMLESAMALITEQIVEGVQQEIADLQEDTESVERLVQQTFEQGLISLDRPQAVRDFMIVLGDTYPSISWIDLGLANGDAFSIQQLSDQQFNLIQRDWDPEKAITTKTIETYETNRQGNLKLLDRKLSNESYYAPQRPWYQLALQSPSEQVWTEVYLFKTTQSLGISSVLTIENGGKIRGVISSAIELQQLSTYLEDLQPESLGTVVVFNEDHQVIAFSNPEQLTSSLTKENGGFLTLDHIPNSDLQVLNIALKQKQIALPGSSDLKVIGTDLKAADSSQTPILQMNFLWIVPHSGERFQIGVKSLGYMDSIVGVVVAEAPLKAEFAGYERILVSLLVAITVLGTSLTLVKFWLQR